MAFDAAAYSPIASQALEPAEAEALCPVWTAQNPDRALALLFVAPRDCAAIDTLVSL